MPTAAPCSGSCPGDSPLTTDSTLQLWKHLCESEAAAKQHPFVLKFSQVASAGPLHSPACSSALPLALQGRDKIRAEQAPNGLGLAWNQLPQPHQGDTAPTARTLNTGLALGKLILGL